MLFTLPGLHLANTAVQTVFLLRLLTPPAYINVKEGDKLHEEKFTKWIHVSLFFHVLSPLVSAVGLAYFGTESVLKKFPYGYQVLATSCFALTGGVLRLYAFYRLKHMFTFELGIKKNSSLITDGIYSVIRHPSYTGLLMFSGGYCWTHMFYVWNFIQTGVVSLPFGYAWLAFTLFFPIHWFLIIPTRIVEEESMLLKNYGSQYEKYQKKSWKRTAIASFYIQQEMIENLPGLHLANAIFQSLMLIRIYIPRSKLNTDAGDVVFEEKLSYCRSPLFGQVALTLLSTGAVIIFTRPNFLISFPYNYHVICLSCLSMFGGLLRTYAFHKLDKLFTFQLGIKKDATLVTDGLYSVIRHPSYTGLLLFSFAYSLGLSLYIWNLAKNGVVSSRISYCWIAVLLLYPINLTWFICKRIGNEERMLSETFGLEYQKYKQSTWTLIPFIY